jgi:hypothetical protein
MYLPSETTEEIARWLPPREQAVLSRRNKEIADLRKYESITYPITVKEMKEINTSVFVTIAGTPETFVWTKWFVEGIEEFDEYQVGIHVKESQRWEDGVMTDSFNAIVPAELPGHRITKEIVEQCRKYTAMAWDLEVCNNRNFNYNFTLKPSNVLVTEFPAVEAIYKIYARRCRYIALDEEKYATLLTLDFVNELSIYHVFTKEEVEREVFGRQNYN